jgi:disulfide bond formation protein DsbB
MQRSGAASRALMLARLRLASALALLASLGMLGGALLFQYVGGLYPCEMCLWQRIPHAIIIALSLLAMLMLRTGKAARARIVLLCIAFAFIVSSGLGLLHAGVEQKWWQVRTSCTSTAAPDLGAIFASPVVRCDEIPWSLFGLSMAGYNALLSLLAAVLLFRLLRRQI